MTLQTLAMKAENAANPGFDNRFAVSSAKACIFRDPVALSAVVYIMGQVFAAALQDWPNTGGEE